MEYSKPKVTIDLDEYLNLIEIERKYYELQINILKDTSQRDFIRVDTSESSTLG